MTHRRTSWELLYEDHSARVLAYALRRVSRDEALDVLADTFLVAWRRLDDVPDDPVPWLLRVARNVISNQERSARRRNALKAKLAIVGEPHLVPDPAEEIGSKSVIIAALSGLPKAEREALLLVAWENLDSRSTAKVLGCSPATLAVRLHRARKHLRRDFERLGLTESSWTSMTHPALEEGEGL